MLRAGRAAAEGPPEEIFTGALLSDVYRQPAEESPRPRTGGVLITPKRDS